MLSPRILVVVGRIAGLQIFSVAQFGTRASFRLEWPGQDSVTCRVDGDVASELVASYFECDRGQGRLRTATVNRLSQGTLDSSLLYSGFVRS